MQQYDSSRNEGSDQIRETDRVYLFYNALFFPPSPCFLSPLPCFHETRLSPVWKNLGRSIDRSIRSSVNNGGSNILERSKKQKAKKKKKSRISRIALIQTTETFLYPKFISFHPFLFSRRIRDFSAELEKLKKFFFPTFTLKVAMDMGEEIKE